MSLQEIDGPGFFVPARVALRLARVLCLEEVRARYRSTDPELNDVLTVWLRVATKYATADRGNAVVPNPATVGSSRPDGQTVADIHQATRIPKRTIRAAIERGHLTAEKIAGRYWIPTDEVTAWLRARP